MLSLIMLSFDFGDDFGDAEAELSGAEFGESVEPRLFSPFSTTVGRDLATVLALVFSVACPVEFGWLSFGSFFAFTSLLLLLFLTVVADDVSAALTGISVVDDFDE